MEIICSGSICSEGTIEDAMLQISQCNFNKMDMLMISTWAHICPSDIVKDFDKVNNIINNLLKKYDLEIATINAKPCVEMNDRSHKAIKQREDEILVIFKIMKEHNIEIMNLQPTLNGDEEFLESIVENSLLTLKDINKMGLDNNIIVALEPHINSAYDMPWKVKRLLKEIPDMPLTYDPSHFIAKGVNQKETEFMLENTVNVHLRDAANGEIMKFFGDGIIDFNRIFEKLTEKNYKGYISLEYLQMEFSSQELSDDIMYFRDYLSDNFNITK